ncbi:MAG: tryptophan 7-halogenase [Bacteroidota bacterium]
MPSTQSSRRISADVVILGSGFSGSLLALILNKTGRSVVVIDKAIHPRFAIGESSTPIGNMILRDLANQYQLDALKPLAMYGTWVDTYPEIMRGKKRGFSYFQHQRETAFQPGNNHSNELLVTASTDNVRSDTHWLRADIDHFLTNQLDTAGITLLDNTLVTKIEQHDKAILSDAWHIEARRVEEPLHITGAFVVDATGPAGLIPRALNLSNLSTSLQTCSHAIFSHYEHVPLWQDLVAETGAKTSDYPYSCDDAAVHHCIEQGWLWMLRFDNHRVSAGFALDGNRYRMNYSVSPDAAWQTLLDQYPSLKHLFASSTLADSPGKRYRTGQLQRLWGQAAGANWVLLPHTAGFIDPLHSTGIAHTLSGVERVANLLTDHWQQPALYPALLQYSDAVIRELQTVDLLVAGCYPCFGRFELLSVYTMLYFAAAITYEERRTEAYKAGTPFNHDFLCVDETQLVKTVEEGYKAVLGALDNTQQAHSFRDTMVNLIAPYNTAGLLHPRIHNMYEYTATDL